MIYSFNDPNDIFEKRDGRIVLHRRYKKHDYSIGSIHPSNNCGLFRILSYEGRNSNGLKIYKIEFLKSKNRKIVTKACIDNGRIKDNKLLQSIYIGKRYKCNIGNTCTIIEYAGLVNSYAMFKVKFDHTGYETISRIGNITRGKVRDLLYPTEHGIGYLGLDYNKLRNQDKDLYDTLYCRWRGMISRCYNKNNRKYHIYGKIGIRVADEWHNLSNFIKDAIKLPGFDRESVINGKLQLDKDKLQADKKNSNKVYSKDTCCWLTSKEQSKYIDYVNGSSNQAYKIKCTHPDGSITIEKSIGECSRKYKISSPTIRKSLDDKKYTYKKYKFELINQ